MEDPGGFPSAIVFSDSWPEEEPLARLSKESSEQLPRLLATLMRRESQEVFFGAFILDTPKFCLPNFLTPHNLAFEFFEDTCPLPTAECDTVQQVPCAAYTAAHSYGSGGLTGFVGMPQELRSRPQ